MDNRPIGVFDSGIGGLTVAREVMRQLPNEKVIYFGDLARLPYGSKSKENIIIFSKQIIKFLLTKDVKAIIIACGTASSNSLEEVKEMFDIPIIGVVEPGALSAANETKNNRIGIIGTEATVNSDAYINLINGYNNKAEVYSKACPLFVPLVEEGWLQDTVTEQVAKRYLDEFIERQVDTLVLGCTHYPLLKDVIGNIMGDKVTLVNPAREAAKMLNGMLDANDMHCDRDNSQHEFYVTDRTDKFEELAKKILNRPMMPVKKVNIE